MRFILKVILGPEKEEKFYQRVCSFFDRRRKVLLFRYLEDLKMLAVRSSCVHENVGALVIKDGGIVATGWKGAPKIIKTCLKVGCLGRLNGMQGVATREFCRGLSAFEWCREKAVRNMISLVATDLYITKFPSDLVVANAIIMAGIKKIFYLEEEISKDVEKMLKDAGIKMEYIKEEFLKEKEIDESEEYKKENTKEEK